MEIWYDPMLAHVGELDNAAKRHCAQFDLNSEVSKTQHGMGIVSNKVWYACVPKSWLDHLVALEPFRSIVPVQKKAHQPAWELVGPTASLDALITPALRKLRAGFSLSIWKGHMFWITALALLVAGAFMKLGVALVMVSMLTAALWTTLACMALLVAFLIWQSRRK
jgi:hypothetical protein